MALPKIEIKVGADTKGAESGIKRVSSHLDKMNRASITAQRGATQLNNQMIVMSKSSAGFGRGIQNAAFQVGDFAVQVGAGTSAARAMAMQLPQLLGGFGVMGAMAGGAAAVLGALVANMDTADESAKRFGSTLDALRESTQSMRNELDLLRSGFESIEELRVQEELNRLLSERAKLQSQIDNQVAAPAVLNVMRQQVQSLNDQIAPLQEILDKHRQTKAELEEAKQKAQELYDAIIGVAKADLSNLINQADVLAGKFATAAQNAYAMAQNAMARIERGREVGRGRGGDPRTMGGSFADWQKGDPRAQLAVSYGKAFAVTPSRAGGGGGGGGSAAQGNPGLESLITQLQTEREILDEWYMESLEKLQSANERELEAIGGHNEAKLRLENEYQERLGRIKEDGRKNDLQSVLKGGREIVSALGQTNEDALKIAKVFGAAEIMVNAIVGASKELKEKGTIGIATGASVIAAGAGLVSSMRSVNAASASGMGGVAMGGGYAGPGPGNAQPTKEQYLHFNFTGDGPIQQSAMRDFITQFNEALEDGAVVKGITTS
ncbi:hypothetical protein [uncultured Roseovarius sp.]|uniref:hypothetical protein n=1 Tax=uncultured Roseovarius sp. TaxID=293344 RepID=UPI002593EAB1|nr:hypothetical protein [uncultured Roseovarius sp.]